jgi:hypothetical protein
LKDADKKRLFKDLQDAMHTTSPVAEWRYAPKLAYDMLREAYYQGEVFKEGAIVQHLDTGIVGEVIHRGPNYVIYVDEYDNSHRGWLTQLSEGADPKTQLEIGTDKYRDYVQQLTPGQPKVTFGGWIKKVKMTK